MILPRVAITIGDPAGIGPEIAAKAAADPRVLEVCRPVLFGRIYTPGMKAGRLSAEAGRAAYDAIVAAAGAAMAGEVDAVATAPINKESIRAAGIDSIGHTEMYADLTKTKNPMTLFQTITLRVFFLTRHVSLAKACTLVTTDRLVEGIRDSVEGLRSLGLDPSAAPLAVAGLNPHNGEHGLFGDEEGRFIEPAVAQCRAEGISVVGPVPADSVFHQALHGRYSAVLSLYHDQGHIATKTLDFERTISLTLAMPFLRTSVDHGTAFDIAGKAVASPVSMVEAIRLGTLYGPAYAAYSKSKRN
jgi:4-hydroxythreonine-4-phosphate dehydrogenase